MNRRLRILWEGILDVIGENDNYCLAVNILTQSLKEDDYLFYHNERPKLEDVVKGYEDVAFCIYLDVWSYSYDTDAVLNFKKILTGAIWVEKGLELLDVSISLDNFLKELEKKVGDIFVIKEVSNG